MYCSVRCWGAHAKLRTWLRYTVAPVGACGLLRQLFDMAIACATTTGWWCVLQRRLCIYSHEDYSAFLCFIWHDLTRQCRAVLNVSYLFQGCYVSLKAVHCKMMHTVYWRACRWYDWTGFNSAKLLSSTCSTANISLAMVDSSLPKLMHKLFSDALCIHVSVDGYLWSGFNSA